jgi:hypothetical protein
MASGHVNRTPASSIAYERAIDAYFRSTGTSQNISHQSLSWISLNDSALRCESTPDEIFGKDRNTEFFDQAGTEAWAMSRA